MKRRAIVIPLQPTPGCPQCASKNPGVGPCASCRMHLAILAAYGDGEADSMLRTGNQRVDYEANLKLAEALQ